MTQLTHPPAERTGLMTHLKDATADVHRQAENRTLQRSMARGTLPRDTFVAYLGQLYFVHRALEAHLVRLRADDAVFDTLFRDDQRREPDLSADLAFHGVSLASITPLPSTQALVETIERAAAETPLALLGMLYVLEGSNNGSKFVAPVLARTYGLVAGQGLRYLDPYGENQMPAWQRFKQEMNEVPFTAPQAAVIVEAAKTMFGGIAAISEEVLGPATGELEARPSM